jgi:hypothetical protein
LGLLSHLWNIFFQWCKEWREEYVELLILCVMEEKLLIVNQFFFTNTFHGLSQYPILYQGSGYQIYETLLVDKKEQ